MASDWTGMSIVHMGDTQVNLPLRIIRGHGDFVSLDERYTIKSR